MTANVVKQDSDIYKVKKNAIEFTSKHLKGWKERLFIMTQTHNLQISVLFNLLCVWVLF